MQAVGPVRLKLEAASGRFFYIKILSFNDEHHNPHLLPNHLQLSHDCQQGGNLEPLETRKINLQTVSLTDVKKIEYLSVFFFFYHNSRVKSQELPNDVILVKILTTIYWSRETQLSMHAPFQKHLHQL